MNKLKQINKLIGDTPLIEIRYRFKNKLRSAYFKCEWYNLTGSIKDRVAWQIISDAYASGELKPGQPIAETTSGNMGISLSAIATSLGHEVIICMPRFMSDERKALIQLYGGKLLLVDSFEEGFEKCKQLEKEGVYLSKQFENLSNVKAYKKCAKEIMTKLDYVSCFLAGVGTSGTLMGIGGTLKDKWDTRVIAVEPSASSLFTVGRSLGKHQIQGLSDNIIPSLYNREKVDDIIGVSDEEALLMAQKLSRELGLGVGISSGANFVASVKYGKNKSLSVFPDDNKKYLSTSLIKDIHSSFVDDIQLIDYKVL